MGEIYLRILLSNDDGIEAEGIEALVRALYKDHEVIVAAPMHQQSGMAHALTVGAPIEVAEEIWYKSTSHCRNADRCGKNIFRSLSWRC